MINVYEIPKDKTGAIKKIIEAPDQTSGELDIELEKEQGKGKLEKAKAWKINEFRKQECLLREAKAIGLTGDKSYLYIKADEKFFEKNEKILLDAGAKKLKDKEADKIKEAIESQESDVSSGVGFVFG